jgi:hypothetical protein
LKPDTIARRGKNPLALEATSKTRLIYLGSLLSRKLGGWLLKNTSLLGSPRIKEQSGPE